MLFKVTHFDGRGRRRCGRVSAASFMDAMCQAEQEWGAARVMHCMRLSTKPTLHLVPSLVQQRRRKPLEATPCAL
ncbi:hypothetical protein [Variovorax sp. HJSM1_2]|uniref:hypothetical protein n=1 Tax=Variovorax sp. HJSM1_2 TaxID=3366263 RepID=UPI003BBE7956